MSMHGGTSEQQWQGSITQLAGLARQQCCLANWMKREETRTDEMLGNLSVLSRKGREVLKLASKLWPRAKPQAACKNLCTKRVPCPTVQSCAKQSL